MQADVAHDAQLSPTIKARSMSCTLVAVATRFGRLVGVLLLFLSCRCFWWRHLGFILLRRGSSGRGYVIINPPETFWGFGRLRRKLARVNTEHDHDRRFHGWKSVAVLVRVPVSRTYTQWGEIKALFHIHDVCRNDRGGFAGRWRRNSVLVFDGFGASELVVVLALGHSPATQCVKSTV